MKKAYNGIISAAFSSFCEAVSTVTVSGTADYTRLQIREALKAGSAPLKLSLGGPGNFSIDRSTRTISIGQPTIDRIAVAADLIKGDDDQTLDIDNALIYLFISHELLHSFQGLSSHSYHDADFIRASVAQIDYAADARSIELVTKLIASTDGSWPTLGSMSWADRIAKLIEIHIAVMKCFYFTLRAGRFVRPTQIRLARHLRVSAWIYQASRARYADPAKLSQAEFRLERPVLVEFPRHGVTGMNEGLVARSDQSVECSPFGSVTSQGPEVTVTWYDVGGLPGIVRHEPTSDVQRRALVEAPFFWNMDSAASAWMALFETSRKLLGAPETELERSATTLLHIGDLISDGFSFTDRSVQRCFSELMNMVGVVAEDTPPHLQDSPFSKLRDRFSECCVSQLSDEERSNYLEREVLAAAYALRR